MDVLAKLQRIEPGEPGTPDKIIKATVLSKRPHAISPVTRPGQEVVIAADFQPPCATPAALRFRAGDRLGWLIGPPGLPATHGILAEN